MTEEEAKELWCPFARLIDGQPPGAAATNRSGPAANYHCIASKCMAWRWDMEITHSIEHGSQMSKTDKGHCGLAGK